MKRWMAPLLKWPGGKSSELDGIMPLLPETMRCYREPFLGGGAVFWNIPAATRAVVGDASADLMHFYAAVQASSKPLQDLLNAACRAWTAADTSWPLVVQALHGTGLMAAQWDEAMPPSRSRASRHADERHLRKTALYALWRANFNAASMGSLQRATGFWLMRELAYNGMFRTNAAGGFNIPYGGQSYDSRDLASKMLRIYERDRMERFINTQLLRGDFSLVMDEAESGDFIFLDPPYDSPFSTYDGSGFGQEAHLRLARQLECLPAGVKWLMVIASTPFVEETYPAIAGAGILCRVPVRYRTNIKNRFKTNAEHLTISNYMPG